MIRLNIKNYNMILTKKQRRYQHYHQVKLINEYIAGTQTIPSDQSRMIEQAKFTYSRLVKTLEKQIKTIENQGERQTKAMEEHGKQLAKSNTFVYANLIR